MLVNFKTILLLFGTLISFSANTQVLLHPNRGQWHENVLYKTELVSGEILIEKKGMTFNLFDYHKSHTHGDEAHDHTNELPENAYRRQVIRTTFIGAETPEEILDRNQIGYYRNYFLGNDSTKWKSNIHSVKGAELTEIYPGIRVVYEGKEDVLKYSFIVNPGIDPDIIRYKIEGSENVQISEDGELLVASVFGLIKESSPVAWTVDEEGNRTSVSCDFVLDKGEIYFALGEYDSEKTLVIDPELTFSSFTGATSDNWGFTACPDPWSNLYGGGIVFGTGYPVTTGVFDGTFNGGDMTGLIAGFDISITKFNPDGTQNLYSTFLGGSRNETPHSIVTNAAGELYVLGATASSNFPVTSNGFQTTFNGGVGVTPFLFFNGSDLYIAKLSPGGNTLLGSTYIGGSNNDGLSYSSNLAYNYGDCFRGEITVDDNSNVYFASTTRSGDFPMASGSLSGVQDAVYGKLSPDLSILNFSSYYGGSGFESGNSIQISPGGDLYMAGGTTSPTLNWGQGGLTTNSIGNEDAYVVRISSVTGTVLNATILGTSQYDQGYFVQVDLDNNVYVMGQTDGNYPNAGGVWGIPNSGQFIHKLSTNLTNSFWSTTIGAGTGNPEISPTAFLVSDCYDIYLSGWGGQTNVQNSLATSSSSNNFPTTPDAYQSNTNGSNFYIAVLDGDAAYLKYATYMGGVASSANHVDGGTSRFDKNGTIYHAVCGSCGATTTGFTTTPGVWSPSVQSTNCNLAAFKFDLSIMEAAIGDTEPIVCLPNPVIFQNSSSNGNQFFWDFGDGNTSTEINPSHLYAGSGDYQVMLVVIDTNNCYQSDTAYFDISIREFGGEVQTISDPVCPGTQVQLSASGGDTYEWSPANLLNNPNIANPIASIEETTTFEVVISNECGSDTSEVLVEVYEAQLEIIADTILCRGDTIPVDLSLGNLQSIIWSPSDVFSNSGSYPTTIFPENSTTISVEGITTDGCEVSGDLYIQVDTMVPVIDLIDSLDLCYGDEALVIASGANTYEWSPDINISSLSGSEISVWPDESMWYYLVGYNACGETPDSFYVNVIQVESLAGNDTIICPGEVAFLWADGGVAYEWTPSEGLYPQGAANVTVQPSLPTRYIVYITDDNGCTDTAGVFVDLFPPAFVQTSPDYYGFPGDPIDISAKGVGEGTYSWSPSEFLSCPNCQASSAYPEETITYTVTFVNENGCIAKDDITIHFDAIIYVPNTFTPDGNKFNGVFKAEGGNIKEYNLKIFNRWGEIIFESNNFNIGWDGTYGGKIVPDGTYIWVIEYKGPDLIPHRINGHVNLLR